MRDHATLAEFATASEARIHVVRLIATGVCDLNRTRGAFADRSLVLNAIPTRFDSAARSVQLTHPFLRNLSAFMASACIHAATATTISG